VFRSIDKTTVASYLASLESKTCARTMPYGHQGLGGIKVSTRGHPFVGRLDELSACPGNNRRVVRHGQSSTLSYRIPPRPARSP
jgi:hypothetical protein